MLHARLPAGCDTLDGTGGVGEIRHYLSYVLQGNLLYRRSRYEPEAVLRQYHGSRYYHEHRESLLQRPLRYELHRPRPAKLPAMAMAVNAPTKPHGLCT